MGERKISISGTGCALADFVYTDVRFNNPACRQFMSKNDGDGGMSPGKLVFTEELEKFANKPFHHILNQIVGEQSPDVFNIGGPSLVSLIHASQLLDTKDYEVKYYGLAGEDEIATRIFNGLKTIPINIDNYQISKKYTTPFTDVLSDPSYNLGNGERTFINNIGAAWHYNTGMLGDDFFESDIVCFGGTALVPQIHDHLTTILEKAKKNNCITVVNTVYDFRNEKNNPGKPWPLGDSKVSFEMIDVLIMDAEEALKISGKKLFDEAITFFELFGASSFIITNGTSDVIASSNGKLFERTESPIRMPISKKITTELKKNPANKRDTTGCGDNFAGGIITSLAWQLKNKTVNKFNLAEAVSWGIVSGGFACYTAGGTYFEKYPGEKLEKIIKLHHSYLKQIEQ